MAPRVAPPRSDSVPPETPAPHAVRSPPAADPNRKVLRSFQCREALWGSVEQLSRELECSVDYLVNEALKHYLRSRAPQPQDAPPASTLPAPPTTPNPPAPSTERDPHPPTGPTLAAFFGGQRYVVDKDQFILGRGKQVTDLTIDNPNVSRKHAMVERQQGLYFIVDLGSTNGVEYQGHRIARKLIADGDIFRICDHEIRFSYEN